ncbi:hypothetical protein Hanom_Chr06g00498251 [Helianthus anomalus]
MCIMHPLYQRCIFSLKKHIARHLRVLCPNGALQSTLHQYRLTFLYLRLNSVSK